MLSDEWAIVALAAIFAVSFVWLMVSMMRYGSRTPYPGITLRKPDETPYQEWKVETKTWTTYEVPSKTDVPRKTSRSNNE